MKNSHQLLKETLAADTEAALLHINRDFANQLVQDHEELLADTACVSETVSTILEFSQQRTKAAILKEWSAETLTLLPTTASRRFDSKIYEQVCKIVLEQGGIAVSKVSDHLEEDLGLDSLDSVEVVMGLEEEYDIEVSDEDAEKLKRVEDIVEYLVRLKVV